MTTHTEHCAVCKGGRCAHERAAGHGHLVLSTAMVAGTPCCDQCLPLLLAAVLAPGRHRREEVPAEPQYLLRDEAADPAAQEAAAFAKEGGWKQAAEARRLARQGRDLPDVEDP